MIAFNRFTAFITLILLGMTSFGFAECFQSAEFGLGWRRDNLKWNADKMRESCGDAVASSRINFKDIDMYTAHAQLKWADCAYYIRLSADYGISDKGRAQEKFNIKSSFLGGSFETYVSDPVKRRKSEFYDFNGAVGYPFTFCDCRLMAVPLIGFSFQRQNIRVRHRRKDCFSSDFDFQSSCNPWGVSSSSELIEDSCCFPNDCCFSSSSCCSSTNNCCSSSSSSCDAFDPFDCHSPSNIASLIGFKPRKRTSSYRFTWYGFYTGADISYALDSNWTLFTELEYHFLNRCHGKRHSYTAVDFVDQYHSESWAHGFNGTFGTTLSIATCWFTTLAVDFKWWQSKKHNEDSVNWKSTGINITVGYSF